MFLAVAWKSIYKKWRIEHILSVRLLSSVAQTAVSGLTSFNGEVPLVGRPWTLSMVSLA